ncbi:MAG: hypothetical protein MJ238_04270, partial [Bacilli bacterium]|nr:hypothetical protein [Bacilli bacterium]
MEQHTNTAAIEISDTSIKFIVGYCINKMPVIVYHDSRPLKEGAVVDGCIQRPECVIQVVKEFLNLPDDSIRAKVNGMCSLIIPGIGYRYLAIEPTSYISRYDEGISTADIQNLIGIVASQEVPPEMKVVDIVPKSFKTDQGITVEPPYGVISRKVTAEMSVHTVNTDVYLGHRTTVEKSGFRIDLAAISSYAAAYLISNTYSKHDLSQYFYVDMGAKIT